MRAPTLNNRVVELLSTGQRFVPFAGGVDLGEGVVEGVQAEQCADDTLIVPTDASVRRD